ncbi:hypothetical protein P0D88_34370 [Paraburkholderia sp. RL18-103-BIB-C]|jgi:hypothetical protein|uniref:hypothetical protein n=1 Tax=unclassified Paraburkholderia TaxID=2615204 RepID=UPI0038B81031
MDQLTTVGIDLAKATPWRHSGRRETNGRFQSPTGIRSHGSAAAYRPLPTFVSMSNREEVVSNPSPKMFSQYLPAGLKRAKLD